MFAEAIAQVLRGIGANCFSGILTSGGGRHAYESQAKEVVHS